MKRRSFLATTLCAALLASSVAAFASQPITQFLSSGGVISIPGHGSDHFSPGQMPAFGGEIRCVAGAPGNCGVVRVPGVFALATTSVPASFSTFLSSGFLGSYDNGAGCGYIRAIGNAPVKFADAGGGAWTLPRNKPLDVTCFGAIGDGNSHPLSATFSSLAAAQVFFPLATSLSQETDDVAFKEAVAMAGGNTGGLGMISLPAGAFRIDTTNLNSNTTVEGQGSNASIIVAATPTSTPINTSFTTSAGGSNIHVERIGFQSINGAPQTGGAFVHFQNCSSCYVERFQMAQGWIGVQLDGSNYVASYVTHGKMLNMASAGVMVNGGADQFVDHVLVSGGNNSGAACGLLIYWSTGMWVDNSDFANSGFGTCIVPGALGQVVQSSFFSNTVMADSSTSGGMKIIANNGGAIRGLKFDNTWTSSNHGDGVVTACDSGNGSVIQNLNFESHHALNNGGNGYNFQCGTGFAVEGAGQVFNNSLAATGGTSGSASGMVIGGLVGHVRVLGQDFNGGQTTATEQYDINVTNTTADYINVTDNDMSGPVTAANPLFYASSGTHNILQSNAGFNPVGPVALTVGASPWAYTNGPWSSTLYLYGGTCSGVGSGGVTYGTTCPTAQLLGPNETVTITYSAAPSASVMRH